MSTNDYSIAFSEVLDVLQHSEIEVLEKIPLEIIKKIKEKSSKEYISRMNEDNNYSLSQKAKEILAVIYQDFLCDDEELEEYRQELFENQRKEEEELRKKYNSDNIFKNKKTINNDNSISESMQIVKYKEPFFKKILNKIKMFFKKN